jgi:ferredoxin
MLLEEILIYGVVFLFCFLVIYLYLRKQRQASQVVTVKIEKAIQDGTFEPVSLHPVIDLNTCIKSGACIEACPEKDILGIVNGKCSPDKRFAMHRPRRLFSCLPGRSNFPGHRHRKTGGRPAPHQPRLRNQRARYLHRRRIGRHGTDKK